MSNAAKLMPFGMRMHWVKPTYQDPGDTVFGELGSHRESRIDSDLMSEIFAPAGEKDAKSFVPKKLAPAGINVLSASRAQNLGIILSRLRVSTEDACRAINETRCEDQLLKMEDLDMIAAAMPTLDEITKLKKHSEAPEKLRDVEQKVLPICFLSKVRFRVMRTVVTHTTAFSFIMNRLVAVHTAASDIRTSEQFRELLDVTLQIGNFVNHGITDKDPGAGAVKGFAIESLHTLSTFKRGGISALHFLCLTLKQGFGSSFLNSLLQNLERMETAKREHLPTLETEVRNFQEEIKFVTHFFEQLSEEDPEKARLMKVSLQLDTEAKELDTKLGSATQVCSETLSYFSVSNQESSGSFQDFCVHLCQFLRQFQSAWRELESGQGTCGKLTSTVSRRHTVHSLADIKPVSKPPQRNSVPGNISKFTGESLSKHVAKLQIHTNTLCKKKTRHLQSRASSQSVRPSRDARARSRARSQRAPQVSQYPHSEDLNDNTFWGPLRRQISLPDPDQCMSIGENKYWGPLQRTISQPISDMSKGRLAARENLKREGPDEMHRSSDMHLPCEFHVLHSSSDIEEGPEDIDNSGPESQESPRPMLTGQCGVKIEGKYGSSDPVDVTPNPLQSTDAHCTGGAASHADPAPLSHSSPIDPDRSLADLST